MSAEKPTKKSKAKQEEEEEKLLIEFALAQKKEFLQDFLKSRQLHFSGTKDMLRDRIENYLEEHAISIEEIADFLDTVEGWGHQHIFLYDAPPGLINQLKKGSNLETRIRNAGWGNFLKQKKSVLLPEKAELTSINISDETVSFVWVEKHVWYQRSKDLDKDKNDILLKAYRRNLERRITRFEVNLITGEALLALPKIASSDLGGDDSKSVFSQYVNLQEEFEKILEPVLTLSSFTKFDLRTAISRLENSDEVMNRENIYETPERTMFKVQSAGSDIDTREDHRVQNFRSKFLPADTPGTGGNFKWLKVQDVLNRDITIRIHGTEKRIAIGVQCTENEVKYVLSRIRNLSQNLDKA